MWKFQRIRSFSVALLLLTSSIAVAQTPLGDLIAKPGLKPSIAIKDIPDNYKAAVIKVQSMSDVFSSLTMFMGPFMAMGGQEGPDKDAMMGITLMQVSWTDGSVISTDAGAFLVTYQMDTNLFVQKTKPSSDQELLKLVLVKRDAIASIAPRPDITKDMLEAYFRKKEGDTGEAVSGATTAQVDVGAAKTATISNFKQAALGMIMYETDYDDVLPYVQDSPSAFTVINPYVKNVEVFKSLNPTGSRMLMNMAVAGVRASDLDQPQEVALLYESAPWPDGSRVVAFCDGHVKSISPSDWPKVEATLHRKLKKHGKPLPPGIRQIRTDSGSG